MSGLNKGPVDIVCDISAADAAQKAGRASEGRRKEKKKTERAGERERKSNQSHSEHIVPIKSRHLFQ